MERAARPPERFTRTLHRLRVLEAAGLLAAIKVLIRALPFRTTIKLAGNTLSAAGASAISSQRSNSEAAAIASAIASANARLPWESTCLVRALAGQLMLKRRGVSSVLVFGVANSGKNLKEFEAHAWLISGGVTVCGGYQAPRFQPIAAFGDIDTRPRDK